MNDQRVVVVGGGIWGLSTAYHLAEMGCESVRLLERNDDIALETTPRAAGLVGQIRTSPAMCGAIQYALQLFEELGARSGLDLGLHRTGSLMVALTPERMEAYARQVALAVQNKVDVAFVSHDEMKRLSPALDVSKLEGGFFVAGDGYVEPQKCARAYAAAARELGVSIELNTPVTGLQIEAGQVRGVATDAGVVEADAVIVTAGPWTAQLARQSGHDLPLVPVRHQRVRTAPAAGIPDHHPVVRVTDVSCYVRPEQGGYLYGFFEPEPTSIDLEAMPPTFRTDDIEPPVDVMAEAQRRLAAVYPILGELDIAEYKQGMTTFAPDGMFLAGPVPATDGLFVASACAALGIAGSAAMGRWLSSWVLHGKPDEDLSEFNLLRFGDRVTDHQWVREQGTSFYGTYYGID
jgi:4-methylaminobutanoate oxidase (formaldehyde-forming)